VSQTNIIKFHIFLMPTMYIVLGAGFYPLDKRYFRAKQYYTLFFKRNNQNIIFVK